MTDDGDWVVFSRDEDRSVITVNVALQYERLYSLNWFHIQIRFSPEQEALNGMPTQDAQVLCFEFEDDLETWLVPSGGRFAAKRTGQSARSIFLHGPHDLKPGIESISERHLKLDISVTSAQFSDVLALMPSKLEAALERDRRIIAILEQEGDDGHAPRKTLYWIYDVAPSDREDVDRRLKDLGFLLESHDGKSKCFARIAPVTLQSIEQDTRSLFELCEEFGCRYDGWETEVVRPKPN